VFSAFLGDGKRLQKTSRAAVAGFIPLTLVAGSDVMADVLLEILPKERPRY
jgi:hypothetical protein